MTAALDRTHDPAAESWVESANTPDTPFPIQNLPLGRFRHSRLESVPRVGIAIGSMVLDIVRAAESCGFAGLAKAAAYACSGGSLNALAALSPTHATALRHAIFDAMHRTSTGRARAPEEALVPRAEVELLLPVDIPDYTDFFCSMHHAVNTGRIFRRPQPLRPNYHYLPVGYHGRASSVVVSGTAIRRPKGQLPNPEGAPRYAPSQMLDYEVELGLVMRGGNRLGETIRIEHAEAAIFGVCLQNDWSSRDMQRWENVPLGPFLSKSFATSISPWIVTTDALRPFLRAMELRPSHTPEPPAHLRPEPADHTVWDIRIDCAIETESMRAAGALPHHISTSKLTDLHWSPKQMVTHHPSNGCNLRPGDLLGTGTISGQDEESWGCLLERTRDGSVLVKLGQECRGYLQDGDRVVMTGRCAAAGFRSIGLGSCEGTLLAATD